MTDREDLKSYARDLVVHHAGDVEFLSIVYMADGHWVIPDENGEYISDEDARLVDDLINKAEVTVTWPEDREHEFEYKLEQRVKQRDRKTGVLNDHFEAWADGSGYNNTNGGVYTSLNVLKGVMTRTRRRFDRWEWEVEFRVFRRKAVRATWQEAEFDA